MNYKKIVVAGGGVLGSQIAYQAAYCGFDVTIWLRSEASIGRTKPKLDNLKKVYDETIKMMAEIKENDSRIWANGISAYENFNKDACLKASENAYASIKLELNLESAVNNADLVIESMAEIADEKMAFYEKLSKVLPEKTVIVTNSSTLLPSKLAKSTGRSNKYLALHFANTIWKNNMVEVMASPKTDPKYFEEVIEFAEAIRMIPLPVRKEKSGYLLNPCLFHSYFQEWIYM